tara:strand:+ start:6570 stop:7148 length:579 start_codon:yes stop_codon:yes gene_type:complete
MEELTLLIEQAADSDFAVWLLFIIAVAESFFFPIPPDVLLIPLAILKNDQALFFGLLVIIGSVLGGVIGHQLGAYLGIKALAIFKIKPSEKLEGLFEQYGFLAIILAGITPIPYKVFSITAGILKYDLKKFIIASIIGRSIRFFSVALTIFLFGDQFIDLLNIIFTSQATFILSAIIIIVILILGIKEIRKI